jgi:hypothetical protein
MRALGCVLLLAGALLAQEAGGAGGADPARLFPESTFAYVEVDASSLATCLPQWQIAKIATDPKLKVLLKPTMEKLGFDPEKPVESLLQSYPVGSVLEGRAAVGVRGMSVVVHDGNGKEWTFRVSPEAPLDAKYFYRWIGLMIAFDGQAGQAVTFDFDVDFLAVGRPGPLGKKLVADLLGELDGVATSTTEKVAGLDATHVYVKDDIFPGLTFGYNFYAVERDGMWFLGTHKDTLEAAISGGPRASLAASPALARARATFTSGNPVLLAHVDFGKLVDAYRPCLPPVVAEMGDIAGLNTMRGVGLGISLVEGGVRESAGILLDGNPRGFWRILDGMPAGLHSLEDAPPGALAAVDFKLDPRVLLDRIRAFCADVVPGNEDDAMRALAREMAPGFDLAKEVLPALGDEVALFLYPARANEMFPGLVVRAPVRDEAAFAGLLAKVRERVPPSEARFQDVDLEGGIHATRILLARAKDYPYLVEAHFAIHKGRFLFASNPKILADAAAWGAEGSPRAVRDDPVLPLVLKTLGGGEAKPLSALAYVNLRGCCTEALKVISLWGPGIPADWFDVKGLGSLNLIPNHLTGAAISLRHDKDAVVLDAFSPAGILLPLAIAGVMFAEAEVQPQMVQVAPAATGRASLGIQVWTRDQGSVKVLALTEGGAAAGADIRQGDHIIGVDNAPITSIEDIHRELEKRKPGDSVKLKIRRGDAEVTVAVVLGEEAPGW